MIDKRCCNAAVKAVGPRWLLSWFPLQRSHRRQLLPILCARPFTHQRLWFIQVCLLRMVITRWKFRVTWPFNQYKTLWRKCRCQLDFHLQAPRALNQPTCLPGADREAWGGLDHIQVHDLDHPHPHFQKQTFKSGQHYIEKTDNLDQTATDRILY